MAEHAERSDEETYPPAEMLEDLRAAIWTDMDQIPIRVDLYRRNLQRAHVEILVSKLEKDNAASDLPALARGELKVILQAVRDNLDSTMDKMTLVHLQDLDARIQRALDPHHSN